MPRYNYVPFSFGAISYTYKSFEDLCDALECLDPAAAEFVRKQTSNPGTKRRLRVCFAWACTPQGHDYWERLERRLYDIRDKPRCYANGLRIQY